MRKKLTEEYRQLKEGYPTERKRLSNALTVRKPSSASDVPSHYPDCDLRTVMDTDDVEE